MKGGVNMKRIGILVAGLLVIGSGAFGKGWDKKFTASLPDQSFASVEQGPKGQKVRHLPFRDASGAVDAPHLRAALRSWKKVKWANAADAQPALAILKNEESKLCATGRMKCGAKVKKPKTAKLKAPRIKHAKTAGTKPKKAAPAKPA
jgi:hypothetical protein